MALQRITNIALAAVAVVRVAIAGKLRRLPVHAERTDGFNTLHYVFFADVASQSIAQLSSEIAKCRWFAPVKVGTLSTSVATREVVALFFRQVSAVEHGGLLRMPEEVVNVTP
ncbi:MULTISPECIES: NUDIX hydrolase [Paraburkholderia]|uniref:hypothetical protein n=1 Tax=Paraburkholderia TaxID=1822464 RepID=UPI0038BA2B47